MLILAIDLAWTGKSGWVLWDPSLSDPIANYGEFAIKQPKSSKDSPKTTRDLFIINQIIDFIEGMVNLWHPDWLVYEFSDWHRSFNPSKRHEQIKKEFAIERHAQRTLGQSEATLLTTLIFVGYDQGRIMGLGANEAKNAFGAKKKKAAAELFATDFHRFIFHNDRDDNFLTDTLLNIDISDHISDSFILAKVAADRINFQELVNG
jgi:hypothetical protein